VGHQPAHELQPVDVDGNLVYLAASTVSQKPLAGWSFRGWLEPMLRPAMCRARSVPPRSSATPP